MALRKEGTLAILGIIALTVLVAFLVLPEALPEIAEEDGLVHVFVRVFGLYGFLFIGVATLTTPFLAGVTRVFGRPFLRVHHAFSILGVVFITLHPVFNALQRASLSVFVPRFDSWTIFWMLAGRPALIILYIAVVAALLRFKAPRHWRAFHTLMYIVLLFGIVHGSLIGDDFENIWLMVIFDSLFVASMASFVIKRYRNYHARHP